ncbi:hypothetical protein [Pseudomonas syringae group genomosp. 7]|uniref:hypothetical protein n=1 Tax=Pseudomonas syringae group genomosp. 7 TaxID=251699 RepID=UPI0037706DFD
MEEIKIRDGLKNNGLSIAGDDYGSCYSSLNNLKQIPSDVLKIDRPFVGGGGGEQGPGGVGAGQGGRLWVLRGE